MPQVASRGRGRRTMNEINMVPFIDVMLVLLIIFMVTAPLITPSLVATPMSRRAQEDEAIVAYLGQKQPLAGGPIAVDDVTPVALHLLSPAARMITGQVISVDGGWSVSEPRA